MSFVERREELPDAGMGFRPAHSGPGLGGGGGASKPSECLRQLWCNWAGCEFTCGFSHAVAWREHRTLLDACRAAQYRARCCFPACGDTFSTLWEATQHEDTEHRVWLCTVRPCTSVFTQHRYALAHVLGHHHEISAAAAHTVLKPLWIAQRPSGNEFVRNMELLVDLPRPFLEEQQQQEQLSPGSFGLPQQQQQSTTSRLNDAIIRYLTSQMKAMSSLLSDAAFSPSEASKQTLQESLDNAQRSLLFTFPPARPGDHHTQQPFWNPQFVVAEPASMVMDPLPPLPPAPPLLRPTPSGRQEPLQEMNLPPTTQRAYFQQLQEVCIDAAFTFYQRHRAHLDTIPDRKGRALCFTPSGRAITCKTDLTLPQWTHLLRRLSDAKGLRRDMVSRLESFNGEIQPVDEVRHACSKNKEKSDRDLLALVQCTRCFCWQLRDWEKCALLDELYAAIEEEMGMARRDREVLLRPQRMKRASSTWPMTQTAEEAVQGAFGE